MSHYVGLCFGDSYDSNLEHYYEGLEVEPYIVKTKKEAIQFEKEAHESNYEYAEKMLLKTDLSEDTRKRFNDIVAKGLCLSDEAAWEQIKSRGYKMDEDENILSTYNPDSKWDWYEVGGRWSGFLVLKDRDAEGDIIETNSALFSEIDWDYMKEHSRYPYCIVDDDGDWHERGEMGWFGVSFNEKEAYTWEEEVLEYLKTVPDDCLVTVVDFHI